MNNWATTLGTWCQSFSWLFWEMDTIRHWEMCVSELIWITTILIYIICVLVFCKTDTANTLHPCLWLSPNDPSPDLICCFCSIGIYFCMKFVYYLLLYKIMITAKSSENYDTNYLMMCGMVILQRTGPFIYTCLLHHPCAAIENESTHNRL